MGAGIVLQSAAADPRIEAVVAEASFANLREAAYDYAGLRKYPWLGKTIFAPGTWTLLYRDEKLAGFPVAEVSPQKSVAARAFPVLLICDEQDVALPCRHSEMIYAAARGPKQLWVVPRAFHTAAYGFEPEEFRRRVLSFFAAYSSAASVYSAPSALNSYFFNFEYPTSVPFPVFQFPFSTFTAQCTGCCRASHSWLSRRTVSRKRTASAAIVSRRCSPPYGSLPSLFR
jgi:hypothetical protein